MQPMQQTGWGPPWGQPWQPANQQAYPPPWSSGSPPAALLAMPGGHHGLPGHDPTTEHRMQIEALEERAMKHGTEIDGLKARVEALEKVKDVAKRYSVWALMALGSLAGHFNKDPLVGQIAWLLELAIKALAK